MTASWVVLNEQRQCNDTGANHSGGWLEDYQSELTWISSGIVYGYICATAERALRDLMCRRSIFTRPSSRSRIDLSKLLYVWLYVA